MYYSQRDKRQKYGLYLRNEAASKLGVSQWWLGDHRDKFPPSSQLGRRKVYTCADLARIETYLKTYHPNANKVYQKYYEQGYLSITEASRRYDIPKITWNVAIADERIPGPTHQFGTKRFYTVDEAEEIVEYFMSHRQSPQTFNTTQVATLLKSPIATILALAKDHDIGFSPCARRRWFTGEDIDQLKTLL